MAVPPNIDPKKTTANISKEFPKLRKPENISRVIFAGLSLQAISLETSRKRIEFEAEGATTYGISNSVKLKVLNIKKFRGPPFFIYKRPGVKAKTPIEQKKALQHERSLLYKHLSKDSSALQKVVAFFKLENNIEEVKNVMEDGDLYKQTKSYDDVFLEALKIKNWHNEEYDYYWMGYRRRSARYWLTSLGQQLAAQR